jgi:anthraniloyl-CoA monooxygenase
MAAPPPPLFAPLDLAGVRIQNRVVLRTLADGPLVPAVGERLQQEPGLVLTPFVAVGADGRITPATPTADELSAFVPGVDRAPVCVVLGHAGRRGSTRPRNEGLDRPLPEGGWDLMSASPIPFGPRSAAPAELDRAGMDRVAGEFVAGAKRAAEAGAGAVMLECSRGTLLASFLSPLSNRRDDDHGGQVEARLRFPLEVLAAVRSAWDGPLGVRYSATDWAPGGLSRADSLAIARAFAAGGADFLDVVAGGTVAEQRPVYGRFFLVAYSDVVRNEVGIPTMTSGNLTTADEVNTVLAAGRADLVVLDPRPGSRPTVRDGAP